jgi:hypothetical protein
MSLSDIYIDVFENDIAKYFTYKDLAKMTSVSKAYDLKHTYQQRYPTLNKYIKNFKINIGALIEKSCFSQTSFHYIVETIEKKQKLPLNFMQGTGGTQGTGVTGGTEGTQGTQVTGISLKSPEYLSDESVFSTFKIFKIFKLISHDINCKKNAYVLTIELTRYFVQIFKYRQQQIGHYICDEYHIFKFVHKILKSEKGKLWYMVSINLYHVLENSILLKFEYLPVLQQDKLTNTEVEGNEDDDFQLMISLDIIMIIFFGTERDDVKMYLLMEILNLVTKIKQLQVRLTSIKVLLSKIDQFIMTAENDAIIHETFKTKFITYLNDFREKNQIR